MRQYYNFWNQIFVSPYMFPLLYLIVAKFIKFWVYLGIHTHLLLIKLLSNVLEIVKQH